MPGRLSLVTEHAARILLEGIIDYAGLFPPASLPMNIAVRNFAHYRASGSGWMLGRFVCPANALDQFSASAEPLLPRDAGAIPWRLSATASDSSHADVDRMSAFNERHRVCFDEAGAVVDSYEVKVSSEQQIADLDALIPRDVLTYFELPLTTASALMPAVAATGRRAKIRTGGVTAEAFPTADAIVGFLESAVEHGVAVKATAGLHHPLRGTYRLTYDEQPPLGCMFGYLNMFLAAAMIAQHASPHDVRRALDASNSEAFSISETRVDWEYAQSHVEIDRMQLLRLREQVLVSFGSCSFTEPVDEIRAQGWI